MIERYSLTATPEKISERFSVDIPELFKPRYNACPTQLMPVITSASPQGISTFYWGTSPEWSKNKPLSEKIINTPVEYIAEKPAIKRAMMKTRCIIPADGFYAWKKAGKKTFIPYRFICTDQDIFSFAGLWEEYEDTDGNEFHTFTMVTLRANKLIASIYDRMPVILSKKEESIWLNPESTEDDLTALLNSYPGERMNLYSVSPRISDAKADAPSLIIPAPAADQFGNLTLFD
jgi:putative SOS response-associated peptidase YedK